MEKLYPTGPIGNLIKQMSRLQRFREKNLDRFETLTDREIQVLTLVGNGMNNPAVAEQLGISWATVQNHRARIRDKLHIDNQADYIIYALAYDLIRI